MKLNGEAIYGTSRWEILREGPTRVEMKGTKDREKYGFNLKFTHEDFWFTSKENNIYAIALAEPLKNKAAIKSLSKVASRIKNISMIGNGGKLDWKFENDAIIINLPVVAEYTNQYKNGFVLKIELEK